MVGSVPTPAVRNRWSLCGALCASACCVPLLSALLFVAVATGVVYGTSPALVGMTCGVRVTHDSVMTNV
jgi:hypothetical protein